MNGKKIPDGPENLTPDVLIPYSMDPHGLGESSVTLISVRPETNTVNYEASILRSIRKYADVVYLASLSGSLVNKKAIVASHYSSQLQFAINGKKELSRYPEMKRLFREKFMVEFEAAPIIGPFEALLDYRLKRDADELFETFVPENDFLEMYGQTVKKIGDYYVINYDMPAVITRHHENTAVFNIAVRMKSISYRFSGIHHLIYENMRKSKSTLLIDSEKRKEMAWYNRVRRTYHISRSHIEAMFDLKDYVFVNDTARIKYKDTPLGRKLLDEWGFEEDRLEKCMQRLKENPMVYLKEDGRHRLVNIVLEGKERRHSTFLEKGLDECCRIIKKIDWEKSPVDLCNVCGTD